MRALVLACVLLLGTGCAADPVGTGDDAPGAGSPPGGTPAPAPGGTPRDSTPHDSTPETPTPTPTVPTPGDASPPDSTAHDSTGQLRDSIPAGLEATARDTAEIDLAWHDLAGETGYVVYRSVTGRDGAYVAHHQLAADATRLADAGLGPGRDYCYRVAAVGTGGTALPPSAPACARTARAHGVRVTTFGDSNTDYGWIGTDSTKRAASYVSVTPLALPPDSNSPHQLAGKIALHWRAQRSDPIRVVNHAIGGTTTGGDDTGDRIRRWTSSPEARTVVHGLTRFEAEVLGEGYPWDGGETRNQYFPNGPVTRVAAYVPGGDDFLYLSMGTNDITTHITPDQTIANLTWMVDTWLAAGLRADHLIIVTLPPRTDDPRGAAVPDTDDRIRALAREKGLALIDVCVHLSDDGCRTWRSPSDQIGDDIHYAEATRDWIAQEVVDYIDRLTPQF